ncbi:MAG TPA: 30S ribosomal protein S12 methylthiotransferase RimO [Chitinophagaceae bacterium]|nr:30S ribosomal protein S12 methylthiotransferase RimO [Chitinophagaceae bacterium]
MKTKAAGKDRINIITLGCSKNLVDSEQLAGQLAASGIGVIHEDRTKRHNISVINTCGFIDRAKEESVHTILQQVELKRRGQLDKVFVTGCLSARYRDELSLEIPEVDDWFGTQELPALLHRLGADYRTELLGERLLHTPGHYAYLKISEGCNRTCAFCAIPLMRGTHVSKPMEQVLAEARKLVAGGVREILLIAQELTYYGLDLYQKRMLPQLLDQLADIQGLDWIRLHYAYPDKFPMEILEVMKARENICKYLDMPLQHINDRILSAMRRRITSQGIRELIGSIREQVPGISLRTTLIVGFPGETSSEFEELMDFVRETRFDRLGIFTYSPEEGTRAYPLPDDVPAEQKAQRAAEIMDLQREISLELNLGKVGSILNVLVDRKEADRWIGRTSADSVEVDNEVIIHGDTELRCGQFVAVKILQAYDYDLEGIAWVP